MALVQQIQQILQIILTFTLFCVRLCIACFAIVLAGCFSWIGVWLVFRLTQLIYTEWLSHPW